MRSTIIKQLISRARGITDADRYFSYKLDSPQIIADSARELMSEIPPSFGACAQMSATWAGYLKDHLSIPAIVVAGDLKIQGARVFKCKKNIPEPTREGRIITGKWDGHCWIEIDGFIGDLSIFRTAYSIDGPSILREYIISQFGTGRGAMLCKSEQLPPGMQYIPKFVLRKVRISGEILLG